MSNIQLFVENQTTYIKGRLPSDIYQGLRKLLGYKPEDAFFKMQYRKNWDGIESTLHWSSKNCRCAIKKEGTHFPTGLFTLAKDYLTENNIEIEIFDNRIKIESNSSLSLSSELSLRDYQKDVIEKSIKQERGIIKMATGAGKTVTAAGIISELNMSPFVFYVPSIDLLDQAADEFERFIIKSGSPLKVGRIGGGYFDIQDVNVMTIQTAVTGCGKKYKVYDEEDLLEKDKINKQQKKDINNLIIDSKAFIIDECQHVRSDSCQIIADYSKNARYRWGMSGTPYRDSGDDILISACFGRLVVEYNASYLIKKNFLVRPDIYFIPIKSFSSGLPDYQTIYKKCIVENDLRNNCISKVAKAFEKQGKNILILCQQIEHGEILSNMIPGSVFLHGKHTGKQRIEHLNKMRNREIPITISSSIFDEGIDCKPLDTLILAGGGKSATRALQRIGRVIRPYENADIGYVKDSATVIDFEDHSKHLLGHSRARKKIYSTESEFNISYLNIEQ